MLNTKNIFSFVLLCAALLLLKTPQIIAQHPYGIIEVGNGITPNDLNDNNDVVGQIGNSPVLWKNGLVVPLQTINNGNGVAYGINNSGEISGRVSVVTGGGLNTAKWNSSGNLIFNDNGHYLSFGIKLNDNGSIGGTSVIVAGPSRATIWINNNPFYINMPASNLEGGCYTHVTDINNNNWAVGSACLPGDTKTFVWKGSGNMVYLTDLGQQSYANGISNNNLIVGNVQEPITFFRKAAYWENEILNIIETPAGFSWAEAKDVNSSNEIVGYYRQGFTNSFGFVFKDGVRTDLNDLLPANSGWSITKAVAINETGAILAEGIKNGNASSCIITPLAIIDPKPYDKWIAGETDTITWVETGWVTQNIKCIVNFGTPSEQVLTIEDGILLDSAYYAWDIPDTILSYQTKIVIENAANPVEKIESEIFRIKPYVLTRLNADSTYYEYRKNRDQWGFSNSKTDMWPTSWWSQFNYQGIDPFTGSQYSQYQSDFIFAYSIGLEHMDWISWVNTFNVDACYISTTLGIYSPTAVLKWNGAKGVWGGSCFGIAVSNALAFAYKDQFQNKYPNFPNFVNPITVFSNDGVKKTANELFSHQSGNPHKTYRANIGLNKTPKQTLIDLVSMFEEDNTQIRTLSFNNNGAGGGGHAILAYGLEKDPVNPSVFYIKVYDNSNPTSNNPITIDTAANGNNGSWLNPDWPGWGGSKWFYLRNPTVEYLTNPTMNKGTSQQSPFILDDEELQVFNTISSSIRIQDKLGNISGFYNNLIETNIPGSAPFVVDNGSETPPYGYSLPTDNYSVILNEFGEDTLKTFFFTGNKSFSYERYGAVQTQTDRLFFDGGVSVVNPDAQNKTIKLLNIINETTQEKLFVVRSLELAQNDSVKIENPDSNKLKLISYGTAKDYDVELNFATGNGLGRFGEFNVTLSTNTSHTFVPDWTDILNTEMQVLVDLGNDGTIDDTLYLSNQITGIGNEQGSLLTPNSFNLAQNYPNPFNPTTKISWQSPVSSHQTLKVYDVLGNEVATLVNEFREAGSYEVVFNASSLASGIYFYKLQAGSFVETKKMILMK
jgi:hypothetical protein